MAPRGGHGEGEGAHGGREEHGEDEDGPATELVHGQPAEDVAWDLRDEMSLANPIPLKKPPVHTVHTSMTTPKAILT